MGHRLTNHPLAFTEDFEVSLFLNETNTRHSLLFKHRRARDKTQTRLVSNSSKLTGGTSDAPIDVENGEDGDLRVEIDQDGNDENDDGDEDIVLTAANVGGSSSRRQPDRERPPPNLLLEDSDEEVPMALQDIPDIQQVNEEDGDTEDTTTRRSKRRRQDPVQVRDSDDEDEDGGDGQDGADSDNDSLFMSDNDNDDLVADAPPSKRSRIVPVDADMDDESSRKKKKLAMDVVYEGFAIYGRVLCLVVKRRGPPRGRGAQTVLPVSAGGGRAGNASAAPEPMKLGGQAAMVNWIASTQMPIPQTGDTDMS